jgi:excisionase family DNA binding protein
MPEDEDFYTAPELAKKLKVDLRTIHNWINQGDLPAIVLPGGQYRIEKKDYDAFIKRRRTKPKGD